MTGNRVHPEKCKEKISFLPKYFSKAEAEQKPNHSVIILANTSQYHQYIHLWIYVVLLLLPLIRSGTISLALYYTVGRNCSGFYIKCTGLFTKIILLLELSEWVSYGFWRWLRRRTWCLHRHMPRLMFFFLG